MGTTTAPKSADRYEQRGVSSGKSEVHAAVAGLDKGLYPGAFCTILPDYLGGSPDHCMVQHADGAGTKAGLAYLAETMEACGMSVWRGIAQDSLAMNLNDMGCAGCMGPFVISGSIGRNKALISGDVIAEIVRGTQNVCDSLSEYDIECHVAGGETADLGDLVRTIVVDHTVSSRFKRSNVINAANIAPPALIVGFASTGQASWETIPNSGMGANGLTNGRHDVLCREYRALKETYAPETKRKLVYCGKYSLEDRIPTDNRFTVASAMLSPTRIYLPLMMALFAEIGRKHILGLIHCSGGGQTKIGKFGQPGTLYVKDSLLPIPPLFEFLQAARKLPWKEMFSSYNCGHQLEAVVRDEKVAHTCIAIARSCGINADVVGEVVRWNKPGRRVEITHNHAKFTYDFDAN